MEAHMQWRLAGSGNFTIQINSPIPPLSAQIVFSFQPWVSMVRLCLSTWISDPISSDPLSSDSVWPNPAPALVFVTSIYLHLLTEPCPGTRAYASRSRAPAPKP